MRKTREKIDERRENDVEEDLKWQARDCEGKIIGRQTVPAIKTFLLNNTKLWRICNDINNCFSSNCRRSSPVNNLLTWQDRHHNLRVNSEEDCAHAELEVVEHPFAIIGRVEEYNSNEQSTAKVMNELNPKHKSVAEDLCHHHLKKN